MSFHRVPSCWTGFYGVIYSSDSTRSFMSLVNPPLLTSTYCIRSGPLRRDFRHLSFWVIEVLSVVTLPGLLLSFLLGNPSTILIQPLCSGLVFPDTHLRAVTRPNDVFVCLGHSKLTPFIRNFIDVVSKLFHKIIVSC